MDNINEEKIINEIRTIYGNDFREGRRERVIYPDKVFENAINKRNYDWLINMRDDKNYKEIIDCYEIEILKYLILLGDFEGFQFVAEKFDITDFTIDDSIFLRRAILCKEVEIACRFIEFFLEKGCDVCVKDNICLITAAENYKSKKIIKLLLDHGADIHVDDDYVFRYTIINSGLYEDIKFWIDHGANIHAKNDFGLYACASVGRGGDLYKMMIYLIELGADIHLANDFILRECIKKDRTGTYTQKLLDLGANFSTISVSDVRHCIKYQNVKSIKILKEHGYDLMSITHDLTDENKEMITLLQEMNMDTMTILSIAMDKS